MARGMALSCRGRTYVAKPEMDGSAGMLGFFEVEDEAGAAVRVRTDEGRFEFPEQVYAVVTRPFNARCAIP